MLKQKSRIKWSNEGDSNTKFFHAQIRRRNSANHIPGIWVDSMWITDPDQVKFQFAKHFEEQFKRRNERNPITLGSMQLRAITLQEANHLERMFSKQEITMALQDIEESKSPGPDGFNSKYIKLM